MPIYVTNFPLKIILFFHNILPSNMVHHYTFKQYFNTLNMILTRYNSIVLWYKSNSLAMDICFIELSDNVWQFKFGELNTFKDILVIDQDLYAGWVAAHLHLRFYLFSHH